MSIEEIYQKIWKRKLRTLKERPPHETLCSARMYVANKLIGVCHRLLDVGCGAGNLAALIKDRCQEIYGVDISSEALRMAVKKGVKTTRVDLNVELLPFQNEWFDTVVCLDVIEHLLDPERLLEEAKRVLKPGGILIISFPNIRWWVHIASLAFFGKFPKTSTDPEAYDGGHLHYFTYKDMEVLLKKHGFKVTEKCGVPSSLPLNLFMEFKSPGIVIKAKKHIARAQGTPRNSQLISNTQR